MLKQTETAPTAVDSLGWRMRLALAYAGLSVGELADYLEVSLASMRAWTSGRSRPRTSTLRDWAVRCGVDYDWMTKGVDLSAADGAECERIAADLGMPHTGVDAFAVVLTLDQLGLLLVDQGGRLAAVRPGSADLPAQDGRRSSRATKRYPVSWVVASRFGPREGTPCVLLHQSAA
jgi:transcriptional regulator with XRE-family HTH domain